MTSEGLGEMFKGDFSDTSADNLERWRANQSVVHAFPSEIYSLSFKRCFVMEFYELIGKPFKSL